MGSQDLIDSRATHADRSGHVWPTQRVAEGIGDHEVVAIKFGQQAGVVQPP